MEKNFRLRPGPGIQRASAELRVDGLLVHIRSLLVVGGSTVPGPPLKLQALAGQLPQAQDKNLVVHVRSLLVVVRKYRGESRGQEPQHKI